MMMANAPTNLGQFNLVLSDITNALSAIAQEPSFNLFINGKSTPSESIVSLGQSRTLTIVIEESHKVSADNLQLDFWLPRDLDPTNCIAEGWTLSPNKPFLHQSGLLHEMEGNIWTWKANQLATGGGLYAVNRFEFKKEAALSNFLARFDIAASRAKSQKIFVQFLVNE